MASGRWRKDANIPNIMSCESERIMVNCYFEIELCIWYGILVLVQKEFIVRYYKPLHSSLQDHWHLKKCPKTFV